MHRSDKKLFRQPVDPEVQELINSVSKHSDVSLENVFTYSEVEEATQELSRLANGPDTAGLASAGGRNKFEGFCTWRIYSLLNKSSVSAKFAMHLKVVALDDYIGQGHRLGAECGLDRDTRPNSPGR
ncbi:hypothetical protein ACJZ2D_005479 [Fusarium nematophilum]